MHVPDRLPRGEIGSIPTFCRPRHGSAALLPTTSSALDSDTLTADPAPAARAPLIAVVEDDPATLEMYHQLLTLAGYRTLLLTRGKDAHVVIRHAQPRLVILDLWLEDRNAGDTVLGLMRLDRVTRHIPVLVCSVHVHELRQTPPVGRGADVAMLAKPFETDVLLGLISRMIA